MRIMMVAPRSITGHVMNQGPFRFDYAFWNFFLPLTSLGHQVNFFDTQIRRRVDFDIEFESFKPDLLFCVMTGNSGITPEEPWEQIQNITQSGVCKTFNWYCDDTWRFSDFSSKTCSMFHFCSTTEKDHIEKYRKIGYENVRHTNWHSNPDLYGSVSCRKNNLLSFIGNLSSDRTRMLNLLELNGFPVSRVERASFEDMVYAYSSSLAGINFTKNVADNKTQMKARIFEIPATRSLLITEYCDGLEDYFDLEREIITFKNDDEMIEKVKWVANNQQAAFEIGLEGHRRYLKDHTSQVRLSNLLSSLS
jgi:spore maturation protein CgeB